MESSLASRPIRAFSLLELLTVVVIGMIVVAMVLPAISSILEGQRITDTGARLAAMIERGRMHAIVRHRIVGVRFFEIPQNSGLFTAADLIEIEPVPDLPTSLQTNSLARLFRFPEPVVISQAHSSLFDSASGTSSTFLPGEGDVSYRSFLIFPDGSTSLTATETNPYLGVLSRPDSMAPDTARNPLVLSLDPRTCRVSTYRK